MSAPERIIEGNGVDHVLVPIKFQDLFAGLRVPDLDHCGFIRLITFFFLSFSFEFGSDLACTIVATSDKLIPGLVKCTVCERQDVRLEKGKT